MTEPAHDGQPGYEELLAKLCLEDKVSLLTGGDHWHLRAHPGIGLGRIRTSDGPAGVRGPRWNERDTALNVPAPVALAATWDPRRAELGVGRSSRDLPLSVTVTVSPGTAMPDGSSC
jgi:beta-glucosidase